jgi:hypothetical protein
MPAVNFNHLYLVLDSSDLAAIKASGFIKNNFAATATKTTKANGRSWTGTYLYGLDNYFEIFDSSGVGEPAGNAGIGLSVDGIGEIDQLNALLAKKYKTGISLREKQFDGKKVPWFKVLDIDDPDLFSRSHISLWVMEYKPEYFSYNDWPYKDNRLTRKIYLDQYNEERKDKILKRFTDITFKVTSEERTFFSNFLLNCGYKKLKEDSFASPENFIFHFIRRNKNDRYAVASVSFESNSSRNGTERISKNIKLNFIIPPAKFFLNNSI